MRDVGHCAPPSSAPNISTLAWVGPRISFLMVGQALGIEPGIFGRREAHGRCHRDDAHGTGRVGLPPRTRRYGGESGGTGAPLQKLTPRKCHRLSVPNG